MPNWCENEIRVSGDTKKVKAFMKFVKSKDQDFDFEKVIPLPKGEWDYQWCLDNWDTKWNACDVVHPKISLGNSKINSNLMKKVAIFLYHGSIEKMVWNLVGIFRMKRGRVNALSNQSARKLT